MKKTLLATGIVAALGASVSTTANAAFTALTAGDYTMSITSGCFAFGNCQTSGGGVFTDNTAGQATFTTAANTATGVRATNGGIVGSGTVGGTNGTINFSIDGAGDMTISSYAQDSYLATAGGTFFVDAAGASGTSLMTGNIDGSGNVLFTPTGREGLAAGFNTGIGVASWNDSKKILAWDSFSTGTTTNVAKGTAAPAFSVTGSVLVDDGSGGWTGTLASTGNINGDNWAGFNNVQFSEVFNVEITAVPVPAAAWLFGSGLLGLVGVARRRKNS